MQVDESSVIECAAKIFVLNSYPQRDKSAEKVFKLRKCRLLAFHLRVIFLFRIYLTAYFQQLMM